MTYIVAVMWRHWPALYERILRIEPALSVRLSVSPFVPCLCT